MKTNAESQGQRAKSQDVALGGAVPTPYAAASRRGRPGYILFELVIALSIFAISVLGLAKALNHSMELANQLRREQIIRIGMRNFLEEIRRKPLTEMSTSTVDATSGVTYTSSTEPVSLRTTNGGTLTDLYNLTIKAASSFNDTPQEDTMSVYVYKPAQK